MPKQIVETCAVFSALADPSRRFVVEQLASRGTATPTELAADLPVTRQAVTKHLFALREAGLVEVQRAGRETRYALTPEPLPRRPTGSRKSVPPGTPGSARCGGSSRGREPRGGSHNDRSETSL